MIGLSEGELADLGALALATAEEAAALAVLGYRAPKATFRKGDKDLVTEYDMRAEELIRERLGRRVPELPVVAEEGGGTAGAVTWLVDPIDGTTNYAHGHPFWCVSIGLALGNLCLAGAVVAPVLGIRWLGVAGRASTRNGEPCRTSDASALEDSLLATGFPYDRRTSTEDNFGTFFAIKRQALGIRRCGSAAIDLCFVADGTYDGYWERKLRPWDIAAGVCIAQGAGAIVTDLVGGPLDLSTGQVVASSPKLFAELLFAIAAASGEGAPRQVP
jgi:myo-inositol-1(or 4)-monophosphatase